MDAMKCSSRKVTFINSILFTYLLLTILAMFMLTSSSFADEKIGNNSNTVIQQIGVKSPGTDLWRAVRKREFDGSQGLSSTSQVKSMGAGALINIEGQQWRSFRRDWLLPYGGYFLIGVMGVLLLLYILVRKVKIPNGRSGKTITRMSTMQRISHWFMVVLVGFMALTGVLLLFGRFVAIPVLGVNGFSVIASASKEGHNLFGPLVVVSLVFMLIYFIRYNWPAKGDLKWLFTLGGLFSKKHLDIGFFNAGEKLLFWLTIWLGVILSITGMLLLFPYYEQTEAFTQLAIVIHAIAALLLIAIVFAHVWMALKVEGTMDAMKDGEVDENWAKSHHSRWYEEATDSKPLEGSQDVEKDVSEYKKEGAY